MEYTFSVSTSLFVPASIGNRGWGEETAVIFQKGIHLMVQTVFLDPEVELMVLDGNGSEGGVSLLASSCLCPGRARTVGFLQASRDFARHVPIFSACGQLKCHLGCMFGLYRAG